MEGPKWVNEKIVSEMTSLSCQTLRNQRFQGVGIPYSKLRAAVRYKVTDVIKFMESRKIIPQNER